MPKRDPHAVLGVETGASAATIKAAWRRLARRHHPDVIGNDPTAARAATRTMAEINAAYQELRDRPKRPAPFEPATNGPTASRRPGGPPPPKATRPVTARLDTTETLRPRNATTTQRGSRAHPLPGQPPISSRAGKTGPPRASDPNGPLLRSRVRRFRPPELPSLSTALSIEMPFGKFHGHTLGEIAAFEPSYIDWMSSTITRDPDLVAAARVVRDELDRRGVVRRTRVTHRFDQPTDL